jgi:hypothetical protein
MSHDTTIQQWLISVTGYDDQHVIRANPGGPRPEGNHATYLQISDPQSDFVAETKTTDLGVDDVQVEYVFASQPAYSVNIYDQNGSAIMAELWRSRQLLVPRKALRDGGLVLAAKSDTVAVPKQGDVAWLPQYAATFDFRAFDSSTEINQKILEYEITGKWGQDDLTITVP